MKHAILLSALVATLGCGSAAGQGSPGQTPSSEHAHGEQGCRCPHCQGGEHGKHEGMGHQGGMHHGGEHGGMHHDGEHGGMHHGGEHGGMHHGGEHGGMRHGHDGPLVHRFDKADDWAKEFDDPARDAWQKPAEVVTAMNISPGMTVADIGAGTGYFEPHLSRAVGPTGKVLALDIEPDMVRYLRQRAEKEKLSNVTAQQVTPGDTGLAAGSVDRVLIVDTWHHIPERTAYAQKLRTALRPGGVVVIVDFTLEAKKGPPKEHRLPAEKVIAELEAGGLSGKAIEESLPEQYIVVARAK